MAGYIFNKLTEVVRKKKKGQVFLAAFGFRYNFI
jgi:hypothetical protein